MNYPSKISLWRDAVPVGFDPPGKEKARYHYGLNKWIYRHAHVEPEMIPEYKARRIIFLRDGHRFKTPKQHRVDIGD